MNQDDNAIVNARILLKYRSADGRAPTYREPGVFHAQALLLLASYGADGVAAQVKAARESEAAGWQRVEWGARPRMSQREARVAGMERSAHEAPWLWARTLGEVSTGPASGLAPRNHVDTGPRKVDVPIKISESPYTHAKGAVSGDDALLASARDAVRAASPHLTGAAFFAKVHETFTAMRAAQRKAAKGGAR